jgi:hypothetical protein
MNIREIGLVLGVLSAAASASASEGAAQEPALKKRGPRGGDPRMQCFGCKISRLQLGQHRNVCLSDLHGRTPPTTRNKIGGVDGRG